MHITTNICRTSIYDNSIFDGISKCIQRILPRRTNVQNLLNALSQSCNMDKVYLFDTHSKLCIAMDSTPNESGLYELYCSDAEKTDASTLADVLKAEEEQRNDPVVSSIV